MARRGCRIIRQFERLLQHWNFRNTRYVTAAATYALLDEEGFSLEVKAGAVNKFSIAPDGVELSTPKSEVMWTCSFRLGNSECKRLSIDGIQLLATRITEGKFRRRRYQRRQIHGPMK